MKKGVKKNLVSIVVTAVLLLVIGLLFPKKQLFGVCYY